MSSQKILECLTPQDDFLQIVIITLLATTYFSLGEFRRTIRYLESWEDFFSKLDSLAVAYNAKQWQLHLHLIALLGECYLAEGTYEKCIEVFN
jgi:hypothetical protein